MTLEEERLDVLNRCVLDDPRKIEGTQDVTGSRLSQWVHEGMQHRLNDLSGDAVVIIMARAYPTTETD